MDKKFGIIMFEGRMYNLDDMNSEEIKELLEKMKENHKMLEKQAEALSGMHTKEEGAEIGE